MKIMTHFWMVLGMKKMRTRCKHSVADAVSNKHPCVAEGTKPHIRWA